ATAGALAGAAAMTSLQTSLLALVLAAAAATLGSRRHGVRVVVGIAVVVIATHVASFAVAGQAFVDQVHRFHLAKNPVPGEGQRALAQLVLHNSTLFALGAAGLGMLGSTGGPPRRLAAVLAGAVGVHLL